MTRDQQKYCSAIMRNLKKHRDAAPFLNPVDYVKLNVLDYPDIVKQPMDLMMVDRKLNASEYASVDEFVADVRLIFNNCFKYNGPEAMISVLCQNVESAFEKSLRQMPASSSKESSPQTSVKKELSPPLSQHNSPPQHVPEYKLLSEDLGRPKREIHCPSKDYPETYTTQRKLAHNKSSAIKFCLQTLKELKKAKYRHLVYPFLEPVDPVALGLPDYTDIVKHPMDLRTIEDKLMNDEYKHADQFEADITLMFDNCYLYNPPSLPIYGMAKELEKIFKDKWAQRPAEKKVESDVEEYESDVERVQKRKPRRASTKQRVVVEEEDIDERDDRIAQLERNIASISEQIKSIKSQKKAASPPKPARRGRGPNKKQPAIRRKRAAYSSDESSDEEEFTFEQKKDLSEMINNLTGEDLNTVVSIIQSSMPSLSGVSHFGFIRK
jgi:bromodomain-containing factor 1